MQGKKRDIKLGKYTLNIGILCIVELRCINKIMPPSKHTAAASFAWANDAKGNLQPTISFLLKLNHYRRLEIWRPLLALCQMHMVCGKGHAGASDRCTKLSEMNKRINTRMSQILTPCKTRDTSSITIYVYEKD